MDMVAFWKIQLDYIYFCYGLSFILLGASCLYYERWSSERFPLSLRSLGLFGIIHGGYEWIELLALNVGDDPRFRIARLIVMAVSFFLLWEAGRSGFGERGRRYLLPYPLLVLILIVATVSDGDTGAANGEARYLLAFPGGMLAAGVLLRHALTLTGQTRLWLMIVAIAFGGYAVATGLIVPASGLVLTRFLNQDILLAATGVPVQDVRCFFAMVAAFALIRHQCELATPHPLKCRLRRQLWHSALSLSAVLAVGGLLTQELGDYFEGELLEDVAIELSLLSGTVSGLVTAADSTAAALTTADRQNSTVALVHPAIEGSRSAIVGRDGEGTARVMPPYCRRQLADQRRDGCFAVGNDGVPGYFASVALSQPEGQGGIARRAGGGAVDRRAPVPRRLRVSEGGHPQDHQRRQGRRRTGPGNRAVAAPLLPPRRRRVQGGQP